MEGAREGWREGGEIVLNGMVDGPLLTMITTIAADIKVLPTLASPAKMLMQKDIDTALRLNNITTRAYIKNLPTSSCNPIGEK